MSNAIVSITKFILTIIFLYVTNALISVLFGNIIPNPDEMKGAIFIYLFIFIGEIILASLATHPVFKIAKKER